MPPLPDPDELRKVLAPFVPTSPSTEAENSSSTAPSIAPEDITLHTLQVPLLPPLNVPQAEAWSSKFWPVVFNPAGHRATIAPPPQALSRTHESIRQQAGHYLALASKVADEAEQSGRGRRVGAVVVDSKLESQTETTGDDDDTRWTDAVVAVAGDVRYSRQEAGAMPQSELHGGAGPNPARETYNADLEGGPELHALMRVVDFISSVRRQANVEEENPHLSPLEAFFLSKSTCFAEDALDDSREHSPVAEKYQKTEKEAIPRTSSSGHENRPMPRIRTRDQGGYLCTDLDVYLTHEPCVCCSMGMLLSRFRSVTFPRNGRMMTGGLASEPVVAPTADTDKTDEPSTDEPTGESDGAASQANREYYGLHWRKELNWRALGFEFVEDGSSDQRIEKIDFHA